MITDAAVEPVSGEAGGGSAGLDRSAWSWAWYQGVRDPYIGLVLGTVFMPYFATTMVGDPVRGQSLVAQISEYSGLIIAVVAPVLGATVDQIGPRKPWLAICTALMVPMIAMLWFAAPGETILSIGQVMTLMIAISVVLTSGEVIFSSMLAYAVRPRARSAASGLALSLGNVVTFAQLIFLLWAFALPGQVDWAFVPDAPLFGLLASQNEPDRAVAPVVALCLLIGALPLFLFSRDAPRSGAAGRGLSHVGDGLKGLWQLIRNARENRDAMIYLVARTVSQDAGMVLLVLSGVLAAGVMGWGAMEMLVYTLVITVAGVGSGALASWLDGRVGPKRALQIEILGSLVGLVGMLGTAPGVILFLWPVEPGVKIWDAPMFATAPELAFLFFSFVSSLYQIAAWSSARTLLTRLAPPDKIGSFFGLAALAAAMTGWLGPMLAGMFTTGLASQQAGFIPVAAMLTLGMMALFLVRGGGRE